MPRFENLFPRGYDLDLEVAFTIIDGEKCYCNRDDFYLVLACWRCGRRREVRWPWEHAPDCAPDHGRLRPVKLVDLQHYQPLWESVGAGMIPLEARRAMRLADEAARPHGWVFGTKTEADFPEGYAVRADVRTLIGPPTLQTRNDPSGARPEGS